MAKNNREHYLNAAKKALSWLENRLLENGEMRGMPQDIACYYKAPTLLMQHGRMDLANAILDHIKATFMQANGDFLSSTEVKSANPAFAELWSYTNGWIAQAAQRLGRFDLSYPAWKFLQQYFNSHLGGWKTHLLPDVESRSDTISSAHLGLASLYFGDVNKAAQAGVFLQSVISKQPAGSSKFYLRVDFKGDLVTNFPIEMAIFEHVDQHQPNQAYFMLGYPIAFLTKLFQATGDACYLETAKLYFDWVYGCTGNLRSFFFSHKVAWGAACFAEATGNARAFQLSHEIADYLVSIQHQDGSWLSSQDILTMCDQTVEIAIWLTEIAHARVFEPVRK
jgi:hypothetical protein